MRGRRRVYLHVGTPKSGTSYLQDKLARNRDLLEQHGVEYLRTRSGDHFEASLDLLGRRWAGAERAARGQWEALATEGRRSSRHAPGQPRDPRGRGCRRGAPGPGLLPRPRAPRRAHRARPRSADPGRVAGAGQAPRPARLRVATCEHTRRHHGRDELTPFWRVQDVPRHPGDLGRGAAGGARPRRHRPALGPAPRTALGAVRPRDRGGSSGRLDRESHHQRLARWCRGHPAAAAQHRAGRARAIPATPTSPGCASRS